MRVKRYVVDTMPEALNKIRIELGKDAVILNSKPIKTGGFLGLFGKQQIEVIAAVDEKSKMPEKTETASKKERPLASVPSQSAVQAYRKSGAPAAGGIGTLEKTHIEERAAYLSQTIRSEQTESAMAQPSFSKPAALPAREPREQRFSPGHVPAASMPKKAMDNQELAQELRDMKEMFRKLLLKNDEKQLPAAVTVVRDRLLEQEVEDELVSTIVADLLKKMEQPAEASPQEAMQIASALIRERLSKHAMTPARIERTAKYAFFFGPTGVGKTTTIAKLAAEYMLKEKRKVGFITSDTFRIAAVEQLRTYANILNVPLEVVFTPGEIKQAMERLNNCDLILVDTAGRNYRTDEYVTGIKELLQYEDASVHYLVLSLTAKYNDMKAIAANFCDIPNARAIFTKADETTSYGSMLNIVDRYELALSYITNGQNVPDDIVLATPERVTKMILGEDKYA